MIKSNKSSIFALRVKLNKININMTTVINLFGGPGAGKSTLAALLFYQLKIRGLSSEMALEYAKDKVWEESYSTLHNQIYVFGKQHHRMWRLNDKVDFIITDSPLLMSIEYDSTNNSIFRELVLFEYNKYNNINFFIERSDTYQTEGRIQTLEEAIKIDTSIKDTLDNLHIPYTSIKQGEEGVNNIINMILSKK